MQNEWAGAQAFSSFDTYLAPLSRWDNLSQKEVKKCVDLWSTASIRRPAGERRRRSPTLLWTGLCLQDLQDLNAIVGGKEMDFKPKDCKKEMDMVNKAFIEIMIEGDANGRGFQYPIPPIPLPKISTGLTRKTTACCLR